MGRKIKDVKEKMKKMKKCTIGVVVLFSLLSAGWADLKVDWINDSVKVESSGVNLPDGAKIQLIWSANGITTQLNQPAQVAGGARLAGEYLLNEGITETVDGHIDFGLWNTIGGVYTNANVGGANINAGYFFTRIFASADGSVGEYFLDTGEVDASLYVYDSQLPSTIYSDNAVPGPSPLDLNSRGTLVVAVPEPATFSLIAIAGLGAFFMRRRWLRSLNKV